MRDDTLEEALVDGEVDLEVLHFKQRGVDGGWWMVDRFRNLRLLASFSLFPFPFSLFRAGRIEVATRRLAVAHLMQRRRGPAAELPRGIAALGEAAAGEALRE